MNILGAVRNRINSAVAAVIGAIMFLTCGALMAFVFSPQMALQARQIERMPLMGAAELSSAAVGDDVLITGWLQDNPVLDEGGYVAYRLEEWVVTPADPDDSNDEPDGSWQSRERRVPALTLDVNGAVVRTLGNDQATLSGPLHEEILYSDSNETASYNGEWLPDGSWRYNGLFNADLVTVLGKKGSTGDVAPDELYAGDRVAFADSKHQAARGLLIGGISMMVCAPLVLIGGLLAAVFGRRR